MRIVPNIQTYFGSLSSNPLPSAISGRSFKSDSFQFHSIAPNFLVEGPTRFQPGSGLLCVIQPWIIDNIRKREERDIGRENRLPIYKEPFDQRKQDEWERKRRDPAEPDSGRGVTIIQMGGAEMLGLA